MAGSANSGGRNAKAPNLHVLQGTFRGDRHGGHSVPEPPKGRPEPPKPMAGEAKAEWERMVERLEKNRTLSIVDDAALYQYCCLFAETEEIKRDAARLRKDLAETRAMSKDVRKAISAADDGMDKLAAIEQLAALRGTMVNIQKLIAKETQQLRQGHMAIRQYLIEFGMTPSARTRVKLPPSEKPQSKIDQLLAGRTSTS